LNSAVPGHVLEKEETQTKEITGNGVCLFTQLQLVLRWVQVEATARQHVDSKTVWLA
jgi:hypothetical protein